MALGVAIGGLAGIVSEELLPTNGQPDAMATLFVQIPGGAGMQPAGSGESEIADPWAEPTNETTLVPAAGPLDDPEQQPVHGRAPQEWLYEEPLDPDPGEPGLTIKEIDADGVVRTLFSGPVG